MVNDVIRQIKPKPVYKNEVQNDNMDLHQIEPKVAVKEENDMNRTDGAGSKKPERIKRRIRIGKRSRIALGVAFAIFIILVVAAGLPGWAVYKRGRALAAKGYELKASLDSQDINVVEGKLAEFKEELSKFESSYGRLGWMRVVPVVSSYWKDGKAGVQAGKYGIETAEIVIETMKPYADIIGFAGGGEQAKSGEESANDRIDFLVQTIEDVLPKMDEISEKATLANGELGKINPSRYPEKFRGKEIRPKLEKAIEAAEEGTKMISESKPLMEAAPYLLGMDEPRTYLVLFQNDKELRPTGGFITAYSIMTVTNGKLQPAVSSDIYDLDNRYKPSIVAPQELRDYLKGPYELNNKLFLRDINWYPDFRQSMEIFVDEAGKAGIEDIDGIIAVDTYVVVYLLDVLGTIGVPGFGNFSNEIVPECDCPQVIYELESFADVEGPVVWSENEPGKIVFAPPNYDNRKKIVGPLMNSVISNALGQEKDKLPGLFEAAWKSVSEKHVLLYLLDEEAQKGAEGFNIAGRVKDYEGDYLMIVDANLGGRKSNLYVTQEVHQEVKVEKDGIEKMVQIVYKNPQKHDGWLNSVLPNWTRIYVPKGSELVSMEGFDKKGETYEEYGKTVFAGGFELRPQGSKEITIRYRIPIKAEGEYEVLIQKQPGTDKPLHTLEVGKTNEEFFLRIDREIKIKI